MPAVTGVAFLIRVGNTRQTLTLSLSGAQTYVLNFRGAATGALVASGTAAAIQTALEGLAGIGAGNVSVTGSVGGPFTVVFQGTLAGQDVELLTVTGQTGGLVVTVALIAPTFTTLAGQRGGTLRRATDGADATTKDSAGWHEELPTFRNWGLEGEVVVIEDDAAKLALERAYLNTGVYRVVVDVQTPAGSTYRGVGVLADFQFEGAHDDVLMGTVTVNGSGVLTKT